MKCASIVLLVVLSSVPLAPAAQRPDSTPASPNDPVVVGRRLFQQHCGVCHTQPTSTNPMYGPRLHRELVNGKEDAVRDLIAKGSPRMPGFRYGLSASEIGAIVEYLKTVPKPAQGGPEVGGQGRIN